MFNRRNIFEIYQKSKGGTFYLNLWATFCIVFSFYTNANAILLRSIYMTLPRIEWRINKMLSYQL